MSRIFQAIVRAESERTALSSSPQEDASALLKSAETRLAATRLDVSQLGGPESRIYSSARTKRYYRGLTDASGSHSDPAPDVDTTDAIPLDAFPKLQLPASLPAHLVVLEGSESAAAESFRLLAVRLKHIRRERCLDRLLISSTRAQEGKSLISANLASAIAAMSQESVLLIEGDIRRPYLMDLFGIARPRGLSEYLRGEQSLTESVYRLEQAGLWILPAGSSYDGHSELLTSDLLPLMFKRLTSTFRWILIDAPPILPLADTSIWTRVADGILLVVRPGITEKKKLTRGIEALDINKLVGAVVNSATCTSQDDYSYYLERPDLVAPESKTEHS